MVVDDWPIEVQFVPSLSIATSVVIDRGSI